MAKTMRGTSDKNKRVGVSDPDNTISWLAYA